MLYYIANARIPTEKAHGYQILQMMQAFAENKIEAKLLYPDRKQDPALSNQSDVKSYYNLRIDPPRQALPCVDLIAKVGIRFPRARLLHLAAFLLQTLTFCWSLRSFFAKQVLESKSGDVIYLRDVLIARFLLAFAPAQWRRRIVVELHALSTNRRRARRQIATLMRVAGVVCVTKAMQGQIISLGVPAAQTHVAPDAVDLESFSQRPEKVVARMRLGIPTGRTIAAFVGKFHTNGEEKGIPEILAASARLLGEYPDLDFYFIGGPLDRVERYETIIRNLGIPFVQRFYFRDKLPVRDVPTALAAADILLMPHPKSAFYAHHVSPLKLFEYMTAHRPIVASALPAIEEILTHESNALLAEAGNPTSIASQIKRLLSDAALSQKIAEQAAKDVKHFTWYSRAAGINRFISGRVSL